MLRTAGKILAALVVIVMIAVGGWQYFRPKPIASSIDEQPVTVENASMEDVLVVAGQVKPAVTIDLRAEASGIVESVSAREGTRVAAGQELVRLDSKIAQSSLEQAEANLRQMELQDAATRLDLDQDSLELKKRTYERTKALADRGLVARTDLDLRETELRVAERGLERARRNIDSSQARIAQARAAVDQARTTLQHTVIRAPFDAYVLRRQVEVGSGVAGVSQSATGGSVLMTLGDARQSALYARATAADARRLKPGLAARVRLDSDPSEVLPGEVESVSTAGDVDNTSKLTTFPIVIALKSQPPGGWVNVPAQADIVLRASIEALAVPERCVRTDSNGRTYVNLRSGTSVRRHYVEVGAIQQDRIQIRSGLEKGQVLMCRAS